MKTTQLLLSVFVGLVLMRHVATAQDQNNRGESFTGTVQEDDWDYKPSYVYQPNPKAIIHQKAQARALQRISRMTAMRWYGMSNERPTASPTPFSGLYSPVWQMPGGRPYAWNYRGAPSVLVFTH
jgi:hypothetical protein